MYYLPFLFPFSSFSFSPISLFSLYRHVQRCRVLVHVVNGDSPDPVGDFVAINQVRLPFSLPPSLPPSLQSSPAFAYIFFVLFCLVLAPFQFPPLHSSLTVLVSSTHPSHPSLPPSLPPFLPPPLRNSPFSTPSSLRSPKWWS